MAITPARTIRLSRDDRRLLAILARKLKTSQSQVIRLCIRAAVKGLQAKRNRIEKPMPSTGKEIND